MPLADAAPMRRSQAAWIRERVWTAPMQRAFRRSPERFTACACQFGACRHCKHGDHHLCTPRRHEAPAARLATRTAVVDVWEAGHRHSWTCACAAGHHGAALPPPPTPVATVGDGWHQPDLFVAPREDPWHQPDLFASLLADPLPHRAAPMKGSTPA